MSAALHTGFVQTRGAQLYYEIAGQGPPVVFLHASIADSRLWDAQMPVFAEEYLTLRYDLRGFGRSASIPPHKTFSHAQDAAGLLDALGIDSAALVGLGLGASAALDAALRYPDRVDALALASPWVSGGEFSLATLQEWGDVAEAVEHGDFDRVIDLELDMWVVGPSRRRDEIDAAALEHARRMLQALYQTRRSVGREQPLTPPAWERLDAVAAPTLIVTGSVDRNDSLTAADRLRANIPGARHEIIAHVGHLLNLERPLRFNQIVLDFLAGSQ
jgi:pimeloyl-ACP methyl ester carboxylesterase